MIPTITSCTARFNTVVHPRFLRLIYFFLLLLSFSFVSPVSAHIAFGNTITCTHPSVAARAMSADEFSGLASSGAKDKTMSGTGNNTSASSGSTATTTQGVELLVGTIGVEGKSTETFTAGSGYTVAGP